MTCTRHFNTHVHTENMNIIRKNGSRVSGKCKCNNKSQNKESVITTRYGRIIRSQRDFLLLGCKDIQ